MDILRDKIKRFANSVNNVQSSVRATIHLKATTASYKCYVWLTRENYAPVKIKFRIRYSYDIELMDETLQGIFKSLQPEGFIDQNDISTDVCSLSSSESELAQDVLAD